MRAARWAVVGLLPGLVAADEGAPATPWVDDQPTEIVVWGDLFARWDGTRWFVATEIETPYPLMFAKEKNSSFYTAGFQVRAIVACEKAWKLNKRHFEVDCVLEDVGLQAALADRYNADRVQTAGEVLDELDAKLSGARIQLQVAEDGRVTSIDLEDVAEDTERQQVIHETLRQVMSRVAVGFDMKMQKYNQLNEGKWIEYHSALMSMPLPAYQTATRASSTLIHYLNRYKGHVLVQSIGKGMIEVPPLSSGQATASQSGAATAATAAPTRGGGGMSAVSGPSNRSLGEGEREYQLPAISYDTDLIGVSIYDAEEGFMTERVWALEGKPTASAGLATRGYWHAGRIMMLGLDDKPSCGPTQVVGPRLGKASGVPDWESIEQNVK